METQVGNLTLLTQRLNSTVSNRPWAPPGGEGKRLVLQQIDVLMLNRRLLDSAGPEWTHVAIRERTRALTNTILQIWPVPEGHRSGYGQGPSVVTRPVDLLDLVSAGLLQPGAILFVRRGKHKKRTATVLQDGQIDVDGKVYQTPSGAAVAIAGSVRNGWGFFTIDPERKKTLRDLSEQYVEQASDLEVDDSEDDDDGD